MPKIETNPVIFITSRAEFIRQKTNGTGSMVNIEILQTDITMLKIDS